jgi:hypothetical protein
LNTFEQFLHDSIDLELYSVDAKVSAINPQFKSHKKWIKGYIGPATAELHDIKEPKIKAIKDENRNAIFPEFSIDLNGKKFFLGIKGCGAYEDMYEGKLLSPHHIRNACRDSAYIHLVDKLTTGTGFIMGESWMGESPYGCQGFINAFDELAFSKIAKLDSINGAHICPVIGVVQLPPEIEELARKFFWFSTYKDHFYQEIRLMPSNIRLYFESSRLVANPSSFFSLFNLDTDKLIEKFEINFIKSGIALLSLFSRSAKKEGDSIKGIIYQDVWLDKDCVVAPDGTIHFADLEGLIWKAVPQDKFAEAQSKEWEKLVFEFLFALVKIDSYRHQLEGSKMSWNRQREELALLIQLALNRDSFAYSKNQKKDLFIVLGGTDVPAVEIPLLEMVD